MKAIVINKQGSSSEMKYEEIPIPEPGQNEVWLQARLHTSDWSLNWNDPWSTINWVWAKM